MFDLIQCRDILNDAQERATHQNLKSRNGNYCKRSWKTEQGISAPVCESVVLSHLDPPSLSIHKGVIDLNQVSGGRIEIMEQFTFSRIPTLGLSRLDKSSGKKCIFKLSFVSLYHRSFSCIENAIV